jgi:DNA repair exonuclease SbcCD ATPase subunit
MNEGQVITKELLKKRFGNFNAARKAYKETHGVTARSWAEFVVRVQNLPSPPCPIPIEERVQTLEDTVKGLSEKLQKLEENERVQTLEDTVKGLTEKLQKLEKNERVQTLEDTVKGLSETLQKSEESANVLSEKLQQLLDRGGVIQESEKPVNKISSYEEFKEVVLESYERLNYDYNYNSFVPIYVIRRDIGDRVTRSQFKEWMLKIRVERIFSLYICDNRTLTQEEIQDSIYDDNLGTQYFFAQKN